MSKARTRDLASEAVRRKRSTSIGLLTLGAFALTAGGIYEAARLQETARQRECREALARGETAPPACRASGSSRSSTHFSSTGGSGSSHTSGGAAAHSSTQGVHFGGFGSTGAAHAFAGG